MSRLGLPVSHSGQNVIHLGTLQFNFTLTFADKKIVSQLRYVPAVYLGSAENDDPVMTRRVILDELLQDVEAHGAHPKHSEELEGHDGRVGYTPAEVRSRVFFPFS